MAGPIRQTLTTVPVFSRLGHIDRCTVGHAGGPNGLRLSAGLMISTLRLSQSSGNGCPWCAIFWEAVKQTLNIRTPRDQDFIYWRYAGESYFEPWIHGQNRGDIKIQIFTERKSKERYNVVHVLVAHLSPSISSFIDSQLSRQNRIRQRNKL